MSGSGDPPSGGHGERHLGRVFYLFAAARLNAVVEVRAAGTSTLIYFAAGGPVFAEQGTLGETLGRLLVSLGTLTQEQYAKVIDRMTEQLVNSEQVRFGEVAIQLGYLTPLQVHDALVEQTRRKVARCLAWPQVNWRVVDGAEALADVPRFAMDLDELASEAIRKVYDRERLTDLLVPLADTWLALRGNAGVVGGRLRLNAAETKLARSLDGTRTLKEILEENPLGRADDQDATLRTLGLLVLTESVEPLAARRTKAIAIAPAPVPEAPAPPPAPEPSRPDTLPPGKRPSTAMRAVQAARLEAERAFQRGRTQARSGTWALAARELRFAAALYSDPAEYRLWALWAEIKAGRRNEADALPELRELATEALDHDKDLQLAHVVRGHLALRDGDDNGAYKAFREAVRLDPHDVDAARHQVILARRLGKK